MLDMPALIYPAVCRVHQVYEALYEAAQLEPLNVRAVSEGYSKYLKHVINRPEEAGAWRDLNAKYAAKL